MRIRLISALGLIAWMLCAVSVAETGSPVPVLVLKKAPDRIQLNPYLECLEDPRGTLTITRVGHDSRLEFHPVGNRTPNFGYTDSVWWLSFRVWNTSKETLDTYLLVDNPLLDDLELFEPADGHFQSIRTGDRFPFDSRAIPVRPFVFPLRLEPGMQTLYLRIYSTSNLHLPLELIGSTRLAALRVGENPLGWLFYGMLLALLLYNICIYISLRESSYFYYILFLAAFILFRLAYEGLAFQYLWPQAPGWANNCIPFLVGLVAASLIQFTRTFLNTASRFAIGDRILQGLIVIYIGLMAVSLAGWYRVAIITTLSVSIGTVIILVILALVAVARRVPAAPFYLLAWIAFLVGSLLNILRDMGSLPVTMITTWGQVVGSILQVLLFSLGLASKFNTISGENERLFREMKAINVDLNHEITERINMESLLLSEKERLDVTLRSIGDGVITTDLEGRVIMINRVAEELTGWSQPEAAGRPAGDIFTIFDARTRTPLADPVSRVIAEEEIVQLAPQTILISRDGSERRIADSGAPIRDRAGQLIGTVLVFRDITEAQRLEEEVQKSKRLESLGILAGGIAHDFNNILTAVLGNISLARLKSDDPEHLDRILGESEKAALRARDLTRQLLTFSRGGAPVKERAAVGELVRETAEFALRGSSVHCEFIIPDNLWAADVDPGQLSQVINNLVINARDAMPAGGRIELTAGNSVLGEANAHLLPAGHYIELTIRDEGPGIPVKWQEKIFTPFFTTKENGSGLGLAISYSIIKKHDGHICVDSHPGQGATFHILLPAAGEPTALEARSEPTLQHGQGRILIMDDQDIVRKVVINGLTHLGYEVDAAADGESAIDLYRRSLDERRPYDVVIMDLTVPGGMGGKETIRQLRELDPGLKAIVSSGYSNDPVMSRYRAYGFDAVITKPYRIVEIGATIHTLLNDNEPGTTGGE